MIEITTTVREAIEKMKRLPRQWYGTTLDILAEASEEIRRIMSRPGLPVRYPIEWDSDKQKWYVIGKLRREGNLPYERTNAHSQGWVSEPINGGYLTANIGHQAVFLYGTPSGQFAGAVHVQASGQSHIHKDRWRLVRPVVEAVLSRLPKDLLERLRVNANG